MYQCTQFLLMISTNYLPCLLSSDDISNFNKSTGSVWAYALNFSFDIKNAILGPVLVCLIPQLESPQQIPCPFSFSFCKL